MAISTNINLRFIESLRDEPKKMLLPISGYEKVTVKSLDDACEAIEDLFDQKFKQYITISKMNSTAPEDALSPDESASIQLYTLEWDVHENSLYMLLNRTLRLADRTKLLPWFKYLKLLLTAFFKLPPSKHTLVWRGVREDLRDLYPKNREFAWWAFSSCTASLDVLESPHYLGKSGARTIFSIQTNRGKDIHAHSYFENENEILLPPGLYFRVVGCLNPAEGLHIIHLCEIPPPYLMLTEPFDLSQMKMELPTITPSKEEKHSTQSVTPKPVVQPSTEKTFNVNKIFLLWKVDDVCQWIQSLGENYSIYANSFRNDFIDGFRLCNFINDQTLIRYGITNKDHRQTILNAIQQLRIDFKNQPRRNWNL